MAEVEAKKVMKTFIDRLEKVIVKMQTIGDTLGKLLVG